MQIAVQNDVPIIVRTLDYESQCCCGLPCAEWSRYANRFQQFIYRDAPPPTFPCCGMTEQYNVSGGQWIWERQDVEYRLTGSITVTANLSGDFSTFAGVYEGIGGTLEARSLNPPTDWSPYFMPIGRARLYSAPKANTAFGGGRCVTFLWIGGISEDGRSQVTLVSEFAKVDNGAGVGPTGIYRVLATDTTLGVGTITVS